jgi:aryl-alcohol dehydrogenase-like predicted oxidoreductase
MKYRKINSLSKDVSVIGLGANIFGYSCNKVQARELVGLAQQNGINYIDTADVYSSGLSEEWVGELTHKNRDYWTISTKSGINSNESINGKNTKKIIYENVVNSLKRLRTDYIDIYQLHHFDPVTPIEETIDVAEELICKGYIKHFGVSNFLKTHMDKYNNINKNIISTNQIHFNYVHREHTNELADDFIKHEKKLIAYGVLGRGVLTGKYDVADKLLLKEGSRASKSKNVKSDLDELFLLKIHEFKKLLESYGISLTQYCVQHGLQNEFLLSMVIGLRNKPQILEICQSVDLKIDLNLKVLLSNYVEENFSNLAVSLGKPELTP